MSVAQDQQPSLNNSGSQQPHFVFLTPVFYINLSPSPQPQRGTPQPEAQAQAQTQTEQTAPRSSSAPLGESSTAASQQSQRIDIPPEILFSLFFNSFAPRQSTFNVSLEEFLRQAFENGPRGNPPAAKSVIDNLPLHTLTEAISCAVCQDECAKGESVVQLPCRHQYHKDCLVPWLQQHNTCPQCRYELLTDDASYNQSIAAKNAKIDKLLQSLPSKQVDTPMAVDEAPLAPSTQQPQQPVDCAFTSVLHMDCSPLDEVSHTRLACGHTFHTECLESHHRIRNFDTSSFQCPLCRHTQSRDSAPSF